MRVQYQIKQKIKEKSEERGCLYEEAKRLLDADESKDARGDIKPEIRAKVDDLFEQMDELRDEVKDLEREARQHEHTEWYHQPSGFVAPRIMPPGGTFHGLGDDPSGISTFRARDGREIRAYSADVRIADHVQSEVPVSELAIPRLFGAVLRNDFRHAEAERRALGGSDDISGGVLLTGGLSGLFWDLPRDRTAALMAGGRRVPMDTAELPLAKLDADPAAEWKPENVAGTFSDADFGLVTLRARTMFVGIKMSRELAEDAPNAGEIAAQSMRERAARVLDYAILMGEGDAIQPTGIRNTPGIQVMDLGVDGFALQRFDEFSSAWGKIIAVNGPERGLSAIYSTREAAYFDALKDQDLNPLRGPQSWDDMRKLSTAAIPTNLTKGASNDTSVAFVGDFSQVLLGIRQEIRLERTVESEGAFAAHQVWLKATMRADVAVVRPNHLVLIDGIKPS